MKTKIAIILIFISCCITSNVSAVPFRLSFDALPNYNYEMYINGNLISNADISIRYFYDTKDVSTATEGSGNEIQITRSVNTKRIEFIYNGSVIYKHKGGEINTVGSNVFLNIFYADEYSPIAYTEYSEGPVDLLAPGSWISGSDMMPNTFASTIGTVKLHQDQSFMMTIAHVPEPSTLWLMTSALIGLLWWDKRQTM